MNGSILKRLNLALTGIEAAHRVARAVDSRREPYAGDLQLLGIDPATFTGVRR